MILQIKNKQGNNLCVISFSESNEIIFNTDCDQQFKDFVLNSVKSGIKRLVDVHSPNGKEISMVEEMVSGNDVGFPLALKEFIERNGCNVIEQHPEIEEEIKKLLADFPDDNADKIDILKRLLEMSYLEQTIILEGLKKIQSEYQ